MALFHQSLVHTHTHTHTRTHVRTHAPMHTGSAGFSRVSLVVSSSVVFRPSPFLSLLSPSPSLPTAELCISPCPSAPQALCGQETAPVLLNTRGPFRFALCCSLRLLVGTLSVSDCTAWHILHRTVRLFSLSLSLLSSYYSLPLSLSLSFVFFAVFFLRRCRSLGVSPLLSAPFLCAQWKTHNAPSTQD